MSDYFSRVAQRALGVAETLKPRLPSRFEPSSDAVPDLPPFQAEEKPPDEVPMTPTLPDRPAAETPATRTIVQRPRTTNPSRPARHPHASTRSEPPTRPEGGVTDASLAPRPSPPPSRTPGLLEPATSPPGSRSESSGSNATIATRAAKQNPTRGEAADRSPNRDKIKPDSLENESPEVRAPSNPTSMASATDRSATRTDPVRGHDVQGFKPPPPPSSAGVDPALTPVIVPDGPRREPTPEATPGATIKVSIGRVEVRAVMEATGDERKPRRNAPSTTSLQDFLERHAERRRR